MLQHRPVLSVIWKKKTITFMWKVPLPQARCCNESPVYLTTLSTTHESENLRKILRNKFSVQATKTTLTSLTMNFHSLTPSTELSGAQTGLCIINRCCHFGWKYSMSTRVCLGFLEQGLTWKNVSEKLPLNLLLTGVVRGTGSTHSAQHKIPYNSPTTYNS